jgi:nicotinate-nucleotide adenylyltransferase
MAPLAARLKYAEKLARACRSVSARSFLWLMGGDNLRQFGQWKDWRGIARIMPIAVDRPSGL